MAALCTAFLCSQQAQASATIHAIGPNNEEDLSHVSCELADNTLTFFDGENNFYTLYARNSDGKCERMHALEDTCKPYLAYCSNKMYKHKSNPVFIFTPECTSDIFRNKAFTGNSAQSQACKDIEKRR